MKKQNRLILMIVTLFMTIGMSLFAIGCSGSYKMKEFVVVGSTVQKEYTLNETVSFDSVDFYALMTDDSKEDVTIKDVKVYLDGVEITGNLSKITETTGSKKLVFEYSKERVEFTITVNPPAAVNTLQSITINASNVQTKYEIDDTDVSLDGLQIVAKYSNGEEKTLSLSQVTLIINDGAIQNLADVTKSSGNKTVKVWYEMIESNAITLEVENPVVGIELDTTNVSLSYQYGDSVNFADLKVWEKHKNSTDKANVKVENDQVQFLLDGTDITDNLNAITANAGAKVVTVKYGQWEKTLSVSVNNYATAISLSETSAAYILNATVDVSNVNINVTWADANDEAVSAQVSLVADGVVCTYSGETVDWTALTQTVGTKEIIVSYAGKSASYTVMVTDENSSIQSITVTPPTNTTFVAGGTVDLSGLSITVKYKASYGLADETLEWSEFAENDVVLQIGTKVISNVDEIAETTETQREITVVYKGNEARFTVNVENPLQAIAVDKAVLDVKVGSVISLQNVKVIATYAYGEGKDVTANVTYTINGSAPDLGALKDEVGEYEVIVSYEGETDSFTLAVVNYVTGLSTSSNLVFQLNTVENPISLNFDKLELTATYVDGSSSSIKADNAYIKYVYEGEVYDNIAALQAGGFLDVPGGKTVTARYQRFDESYDATFNVYVEDIVTAVKVEGTVKSVVENGNIDLSTLSLVLTRKFLNEVKVPLGIVTEDQDGVVIGFSILANVSLFFNGDDVTDDINVVSAAGIGTHTVELWYTDENGRISETTFTVSVVELTETDISTFVAPTTMTKYNNAITNATDADTSATEGRFFTTDANSDADVYKVGDDNAFKFLPKALVVSWDGGGIELAQFKSVSQIWMKSTRDGSYQELTTRISATENITYYSLDGVEYAKAYVNKNEYQFIDGVATGKFFKISVSPAAEYSYSGSPVTCEVKVVDGFNISDAKELCVMENDTSRTDWDTMKDNLGLKGVNPNAIILHTDIVITANDIPSTMKYTLEDSYKIYYKNGDNVYAPEEVPENLGGPLTRTFLWNSYQGTPDIYRHYISSGSDFALYGNYFSLDASKLPLVASFHADGYGESATYYGGDFSNTTLLYISGQKGTLGANDESFTFENLSTIGNANTYQLDTHDNTKGFKGNNPVYAGGTIFMKVGKSTANFNNVLSRTFFIPYFADPEAKVNLDKVKAYDSSQSALFIWSGDSDNNVEVNMDTTYFKRAGGPMILATHVDPDESGATGRAPIITISENSVVEGAVTGYESWFATVGGGAVISRFALIDQLFQGYARKSLYKGGSYNSDAGMFVGGTMNIVTLLMRDATNASDALTDYTVQGCITYKNKVTYAPGMVGDAALDRMTTSTTGGAVQAILKQAVDQGAEAGIVINVGQYIFTLDASFNLYQINADGTLSQVAPTADNAFAAALSTSNYVSLNYGGLGIMFEVFSLPV